MRSGPHQLLVAFPDVEKSVHRKATKHKTKIMNKSEHMHILWFINLDVVLTAGVKEEQDTSLGLLAQLDPILVD